MRSGFPYQDETCIIGLPKVEGNRVTCFSKFNHIFLRSWYKYRVNPCLLRQVWISSSYTCVLTKISFVCPLLGVFSQPWPTNARLLAKLSSYAVEVTLHVEAITLMPSPKRKTLGHQTHNLSRSSGKVSTFKSAEPDLLQAMQWLWGAARTSSGPMGRTISHSQASTISSPGAAGTGRGDSTVPPPRSVMEREPGAPAALEASQSTPGIQQVLGIFQSPCEHQGNILCCAMVKWGG